MRPLIRNCLTFLFVLLTSPLWASVRLIGPGGSNVAVFTTFGQALSLVPGLIGSMARRGFYVMTLEKCAIDVGVGFGTWFSKRQVHIEPRVSIGAHCLIGSCKIGEGTLCGSNVDILSGRRQHRSDVTDRTAAENTGTFTQISIGRNVWIGNHAIVMSDVGEHSTIGAGGVVVHAIPSNSVAVGNPAVVRRSSDARHKNDEGLLIASGVVDDNQRDIEAARTLATNISDSSLLDE